MRLPSRALRSDEFDRRLAAGDRRQGRLLYRPSCPDCRACEAIRLDVSAFRPNRTQRRVVRRGGAVFETTIGPPTATAEKRALYNRHKVGRGLVSGGDLLDTRGYQEFLVESCTDTFEVCYRHDGALVGVAIVDDATDALSAVYCYFDPAYASLSPGVYSILTLVGLCRQWGRRYLYLGLYVRGCRTMAYKVGYLPHDRLIDGVWRRFDRA